MRGRRPRRFEPRDALPGFSAASGDAVAAAAGVRVEQEEWPVLFGESQQRSNECDMLHHVGEVAGVKDVTVLHDSPSQSRGRR